MANKTLISLLTDNKKSLQFLHAAMGFDFEKPYYIGMGEGRFTFNQVKKEIDANITGKHRAVMLILPDTTSVFTSLHYAEIETYRFSIADDKGYPCYKHDFDNFFSIKDFEETRKKKTKRYYIIAQSVEHITEPAPYTQSEHISVSSEIRYKISGDYTWTSDGHGAKWISRVPLASLEDGTQVDFRYDALTIGNIIDKSGYLVCLRRRELKRLTDARRAEREKLEAEQADYSEMEQNITQMLEDAKAKIVEMASSLQSKDDCAALEKRINDLKWAYYSMSTYQDMKKARRFRSCADIESRMRDIEKYLNRVKADEE